MEALEDISHAVLMLLILIGVSYNSDPKQIERFFKRFRDEGIRIPFPIRTVYWRSHSTDGWLKTVTAERQAEEQNR